MQENLLQIQLDMELYAKDSKRSTSALSALLPEFSIVPSCQLWIDDVDRDELLKRGFARRGRRRGLVTMCGLYVNGTVQPHEAGGYLPADTPANRSPYR